MRGASRLKVFALWWFVAMVSAGACTPSVEQPEIQWHGCEELLLGRCWMASDQTQLRLWIDLDPGADVRVNVDGETLDDARMRQVGGGLGVLIDVDRSTNRIELSGMRPRWNRAWTLPIALVPGPTQSGMATSAVHGEAFQELRTKQKRWRLHARRGELDEAIEASLEAIEIADSQGWPLAAARARAAHGFFSLQRGDTSAAHRQVQRIVPTRGSLEMELLAAYTQGLVAWRLGDFPGAQRALEHAHELAIRADDLRHKVATASNLAAIFAESGRAQRALAQIDRVRAVAADPRIPCLQAAQTLNSMGWIALLAGRGTIAGALFDEAWAAVEPFGDCPRQAEAANVAINQALLALDEGEPEVAQTWLARIDVVSPDLDPWIDEVRTRIGLSTGEVRWLPSLVSRPGQDVPNELRWYGWMHRATMLDRWGMRDAAIDALREAELEVESAIETFGSSAGTALFLAQRQSSAQRQVELLLEDGRPQDALCVARIARGRALRRLDRVARLQRAPPRQRARWSESVDRLQELRAVNARFDPELWRLSAAQRHREERRRSRLEEQVLDALDTALETLGTLPRPTCTTLPSWPADTWVIVPFPLEDGWAVFRMAHGVLEAQRIPTPDLDDLESTGVALLGTMAPADVRRILVLPTGRAWSIPYSRLPFEGRSLLALAPLAYGLDLPSATTVDQPSALVVADPSDDLPHAHAEAGAVTELLRRRGTAVHALRGGAVSRDALAESMPHVGYFHYAGHGIHNGDDGWESALVLPGEQSLRIADILAAPRVPSRVVLTGCRTGTVNPDALDGGMNLGTAFVLAGAQAVLVADHTLDDASAAELGVSVVAHGAPEDLPGALRAALLERDAPSKHDAELRVLVR